MITKKPVKITKKLIKQNRKLWIAALLGGEFQQTRGRLVRAGKYCCLGVARVVCDLGCSKRSSDTQGGLNKIQLSYLGLSWIDKLVLIDANDKKKLPFPEIAQLIRKTPITIEGIDA